MTIKSTCRAKNPSTCRFHGTKAAETAYAVLNEAQITLDLAAKMDTEAFIIASENYNRARLEFDATEKGLEELDLMLSITDSEVEKMVLESRRNLALHHLQKEENVQLLQTPAGGVVKKGRVLLNRTKKHVDEFVKLNKSVVLTLQSYAMDAENYSQEVEEYEGTVELWKTGEYLEKVEQQSKSVSELMVLVREEFKEMKTKADESYIIMTKQETALKKAGETSLAAVQAKDTKTLTEYMYKLNEAEDKLRNIDSVFGYRNIPEEVGTISERAKWNVGKIDKIVYDLKELNELLEK